MTHILKTCLLCILLTLTSACSLSPVKIPPVSTYALTSSSDAPVRSHGQQVLLIATPSAAPGYQTAEMRYTMHRYELSSFTKNSWIAPPTDMLAPLLQQSLQNSGCFRAVVAPPFSGATDLTLNTQLLELKQEFLAQGSSRVRMAIQVTLLDNVSQQVVANRRFTAVVPTDADTPYAGVVAANRATGILLSDIKHLVCGRRGS